MANKYDSIVERKKIEKENTTIKIRKALDKMLKNGEIITVQALADEAGVNRSTIYRNEEAMQLLDMCGKKNGLTRSADSTATLLNLEKKKNEQLLKKVAKYEKQASIASEYKEQLNKAREEIKVLKEERENYYAEGWD